MSSNEMAMKIGELAKATGLAPSRIRFYEASGLIKAERMGNGYREYPPQTERILEIITTAQSGGFALEEIRALLPTPDMKNWRHDETIASLRRKIDEIDLLQKRLRVNKAKMLEIIEKMENKPDNLGCDENVDRVMAVFGNTRSPKKSPAQARVSASAKKASNGRQ